jgi:hypothetical protein
MTNNNEPTPATGNDALEALVKDIQTVVLARKIAKDLMMFPLIPEEGANADDYYDCLEQTFTQRITEILNNNQPTPATGANDALEVEVKEYSFGKENNVVMIWVNNRDESKGGYCIENVPRHVAPTIRAALQCPKVDVEKVIADAKDEIQPRSDKDYVLIRKTVHSLSAQGYLSDQSAWKPIEKLPEKTMHLYVWVEYKDQSGSGYLKKAFYCKEHPATKKPQLIEINGFLDFDYQHKEITHWMPYTEPKPPHADEIKKAGE